MSRPRTPSFGAEQRSRLARRAATARWARLGRGVLTLAQIRDGVAKALAGRVVKAFLFGSYARGDATSRSDIDIMVIGDTAPQDLLSETGKISEALYTHLGHEKEIDLILTDEITFKHWRSQYGCVQHEVFREGIRLV